MDTQPSAPHRQRRSRTPRGSAVGVLGSCVVMAGLVAVLAFGGVHPGTRALVHGVLGVGLVAAACIRSSLLARTGGMVPFVRASMVLGGVGVLGLLPVPSGVLRALSPGAVHAGSGWAPLTASVPDTITALTHLLLVAGAGVAAGVLAVVMVRRSWVERALFGVAALLVPIAAVHAGFGIEALFGMVPTWVRAPYRFFAPFLNPNHLASALLLPLPLLVGLSTGHQGWSTEGRVAAGGLAVVSGLLIAASGSWGALGAGLVQMLVLGALMWGWSWSWAGIAAGLGVLAFVVLDAGSDPSRLYMWDVSRQAATAHWGIGSGLGTFDLAVGPHRVDGMFMDWVHAHNELVEWVVTTGVVGLVALAAAIGTLVPSIRAAPVRSRWLLLGVLGVTLHALVDFPLQIPAIGMMWAALIVVAISAYRDGPPVSVPQVRVGLATLAGLQLVAMGWQTQQRLADDALSTGNIAALARVSPWHHEVGLAAARRAFGAGLGDAAIDAAVSVADRHPGSPSAQRAAAQTLAEIGAFEAAETAAARATELAPHDWRAYALRARLLEVVHPEEAPDAWLAVVARGAPARIIRTGWRTLPVGLPWIEAARAQPSWYQRGVARTVAALGDSEAALLGFDQVRQEYGGPVDLVHVRLLSAAGETDRALALVDALLQQAPRHRHALRVRAEVLEAAGRHDQAVEQWVALSRVESSAQGRAVRASAEVRGPDAALALVRSLEGLYGPTGVHASARVEQARALLTAGRAAQCVGVLERSGAVDHHLVGPRAQKLARICQGQL